MKRPLSTDVTTDCAITIMSVLYYDDDFAISLQRLYYYGGDCSIANDDCAITKMSGLLRSRLYYYDDACTILR